MPETEINGVRYLVNKMNVFDQAHVARKVAPIWFSMGQGYAAALSKIAASNPDNPMQASTVNGNGNGEAVEVEIDEEQSAAIRSTIMFETMIPITEILAKMTDEDVNYVLKKCLGVCMRHNGSQWVPMMRGGGLMFEDLDLSTLISLTMEVVQDNLGPSLLGLLAQGSVGAASASPSNGQA